MGKNKTQLTKLTSKKVRIFSFRYQKYHLSARPAIDFQPICSYSNYFWLFSDSFLHYIKTLRFRKAHHLEIQFVEYEKVCEIVFLFCLKPTFHVLN